MSEPVHGIAADRWGGWSWRDPERGQHFRTCSFCGSMHPDDVVAELERGATAEWADQKYGWPHKFYVHGIANRNPDALFCTGSSRGGDPARDPGPKFVHVAQLTDEQREVALRDGMLRESDPLEGAHWLTFGPRTEHFGKFYTTHLADPALSDETREAMALGSGLRFHFEDGRVRWERADA